MAQKNINNFEKRIETIEDILSSAAVGEFNEISIEEDDELASIEMGLNIVIGDLKEQIERTNVLVEKQRETIQVLSTPVITIWDDVLTLPVIGVVDSRRTEEMMESLLNKVVETQSRCVIIDITGVDVVDTKTADHFLKTVKAVKLLGAECFITGISPEIAQTLTNIGVDLSQIKTLRNLQDGLKESFKIIGVEIRTKRRKKND